MIRDNKKMRFILNVNFLTNKNTSIYSYCYFIIVKLVLLHTAFRTLKNPICVIMQKHIGPRQRSVCLLEPLKK